MIQTKAIPNIEVEDIHYLGIIAGIIDDIGMVSVQDKTLETLTIQGVSRNHCEVHWVRVWGEFRNRDSIFCPVLRGMVDIMGWFNSR